MHISKTEMRDYLEGMFLVVNEQGSNYPVGSEAFNSDYVMFLSGVLVASKYSVLIDTIKAAVGTLVNEIEVSAS